MGCCESKENNDHQPNEADPLLKQQQQQQHREPIPVSDTSAVFGTEYSSIALNFLKMLRKNYHLTKKLVV